MMRKIDRTRKQQAILVCVVILAIAAAFPLAYPAKNCTTLLYYCASLVALALAFTRLRALALPALLSLCRVGRDFSYPVRRRVGQGQAIRSSLGTLRSGGPVGL